VLVKVAFVEVDEVKGGLTIPVVTNVVFPYVGEEESKALLAVVCRRVNKSPAWLVKERILVPLS
jgi:hypothetical protein